MKKTHGLSKTEEYKIWKDIRKRCYNKNYHAYHRYGGRGISVSLEWKNFQSFINDMGKRPSKEHSVERKDNNGNYCKENCVWATRLEQMNNTSRNVYLTYNGQTLSLSEWHRKLGITQRTLYSRYEDGWSTEKILTTPIKSWRNNKFTYIEYNGEKLTIAEWSRKTGIKYSTIRARLRYGWTPEQILETPIGLTKNSKRENLDVSTS